MCWFLKITGLDRLGLFLHSFSLPGQTWRKAYIMHTSKKTACMYIAKQHTKKKKGAKLSKLRNVESLE